MVINVLIFIFTDKILKFPLGPMIAGLVVVGLTALLAVVSRWRKIVKVTHRIHMWSTETD